MHRGISEGADDDRLGFADHANWAFVVSPEIVDAPDASGNRSGEARLRGWLTHERFQPMEHLIGCHLIDMNKSRIVSDGNRVGKDLPQVLV